MGAKGLKLLPEVVVVSDGDSRFVKAVEHGAVQLDQRPVPPQRPFTRGVEAEAFGHSRKLVVSVGIGEVARADFGSHVVSVEGCKGVNDAPDFERHVCQNGQGVPLKSEFRKRCVIGVLEQHLFGQMRLFREHIVGMAGPFIPIELPRQKGECVLFFRLPSNLEKMRRDGAGVGVTCPFESGVTDQLVIGHSHAVRLPRCARSKYTDDALDFSVAKGVVHMGFECFRGALLAV